MGVHQVVYGICNLSNFVKHSHMFYMQPVALDDMPYQHYQHHL
jgi:hypothetical protein